MAELTDWELTVLEVLGRKDKGLEDVEIAWELRLDLSIPLRVYAARLAPALGNLKAKGLVRRAGNPYQDPKYRYGIWSLSSQGRKVIGLPDE